MLAHLRASHDVLGGSILRILREDTPSWRRLSPRAWMRKTDYPTWAFEPAFAAFTAQRTELLDRPRPTAAGGLGAHGQGDRATGDVRDRTAAVLRRLAGRP